MPSSPLKNTTNIKVKAVAISQKPNDIIANAVPALLVDKYPKISPKNAPTLAPIKGNKTKGKNEKAERKEKKRNKKQKRKKRRKTNKRKEIT